MKKLMSIVLAAVLVLGLSVSVHAADYRLDETFSQLIDSTPRVITRRVTTKTGTVTVEGWYYSSVSREVLAETNAERESRGLDRLAWDSDLEGPALQRAAEIVVSWSHTRPDGTMPDTVSSYLKGENLLKGNVCLSAYEAVRGSDGWPSSPSHYENMMDEDYTTMAAAVLERNGIIYWVQLFGDGKSSGRTGTHENAAADNTAATSTTASAAQARSAAVTAGASSSNVATDGSISAAQIKSQIQSAAASAAVAEVQARNAQFVSPATLKTMSDAAGGKSVVLHADTTTADGKSVQGRLYVEPAKLQSVTGDIRLGVYTQSDKTSDTKTKFEKWYTNNVAVVRMDHQGSLGARLRVAAKVDVSALNTDSLRFYAYDRTNNAFDVIDEPSYTVDNSGYLHFYTSVGGDIVVTDRALTVR